MPAEELKDALQDTSEVDLTVTGRKIRTRELASHLVRTRRDRLPLLPRERFSEQLVPEPPEDAGGRAGGRWSGGASERRAGSKMTRP